MSLISSPNAKFVPTPSGVPIQWPVPPIKTKDVNVTVKVKWPSKNAERKLVLRGTYRQIANAAWKNPSINKHLRELMVRELEKEATQLCSKKKTIETLINKVWCHSQWGKCQMTLLLHSVLSAVSINHKSKAAKEKTHYGAIAMAAAVCLKNRCKHVIAVQLLITIFTYSNWMVCYVVLCCAVPCQRLDI